TREHEDRVVILLLLLCPSCLCAFVVQVTRSPAGASATGVTLALGSRPSRSPGVLGGRRGASSCRRCARRACPPAAGGPCTTCRPRGCALASSCAACP